jgi:hypothetical protein
MQKIRFFNSGLYNEPSFYKQYETLNVFNNIAVDDDDDWSYRVSYNFSLMKTRYSESELSNLEGDEIDDLIDDDFFEDINKHHTLFEPLIFNEEIALDCGLIPFNYNFELFGNINFLALGDSGFDPLIKTNLLFKLDAYQALTDNSIDEHSPFFGKDSKDIAQRVLGDEVNNRVIEAINGEVIW